VNNVNKMQYGGNHYVEMTIQPWDIIQQWPAEEQVAYYRGNLLKYAMRATAKDTPLLNAQKALHYAQKWVEVEQNRLAMQEEFVNGVVVI